MSDALQEILRRLAEDLDLGHAKRDAAFLRQVHTMCMNPGATASGRASAPADFMSACRFASNPKVSVSDLRKVRMKATLSYVEPGETVLLIHDVSLLDYYRHASKEDRRAIGDGKGKGYEYVCNLAVSLKREQTLGVLHDCLIANTGPDDLNSVDYFATPLTAVLPAKSVAKLPCNHKHIITAHALHVAQQAPGVRFVSTGDREFDDHYHLAACRKAGIDAVIRSCASRNVQVLPYDWLPMEALTKKQAGLPLLPGHVCVHMNELVKHVPRVPLKTVYLDKNGRLTKEGPEAEAVPVSAGACKIVLYRDAKRDRVYVKTDNYVELNVVVVKETSPRTDREPLLWVLFTTLPVDTPEQMAVVVRIYELRWYIECFFKFLKSGFGLEELRFDHASKVAKHLVVTTIAAAYLCGLKSSLGLPAATQLDDASYQRVKHAAKNLNDKTLDIRLRLFAFIAMQGKWFGYRRNGISPLMLMKGLARTGAFLETMHSMTDFLQEVSQCFPQLTRAYHGHPTRA